MVVTCSKKNKKAKESELRRRDGRDVTSLSPGCRIISECLIICPTRTAHVGQRWNKLVDYGSDSQVE